jgi:hypothetical protein
LFNLTNRESHANHLFQKEVSNKFVTTYFRRPFVVPSNAAITNLSLRVAQADSIVVWLNGQEIYRTNLPSGPNAYTNLAASATTVYTRHIFYPTNVPVNLPAASTNCLAVEVHSAPVGLVCLRLWPREFE